MDSVEVLNAAENLMLKYGGRKRQIRHFNTDRKYKHRKLVKVSTNDVPDEELLAMLAVFDAKSPNLVFRVKPYMMMWHYEKHGMPNRFRQELDSKKVAAAVDAVNRKVSTDRNQSGLFYTCRKLACHLHRQYENMPAALTVEWVGLDVEEPSAAEAVLLNVTKENK